MTVHILRLRRTDQPGQHLLVRVEQLAKQLDLKLIGTEHEHVYFANVKESSVKSLQASNYSGDLQEWKETLKYALLHERTAGVLPDHLQGIETVAAISGNTLSMTLRKNIGGITQRLGVIKLEQDDEREGVSPFDWVDTAVASGDDLRSQLETLQASVTGQQDEVAKLTQQLDELVKAKKAHEDEMLKKFAALLNAKKLKIRDQQRLLEHAKIDSKAAKEVRNARSGRSRQAGASRGAKRKGIDADEGDAESDEDEDEGQVAEDEERQQETPQATSDEATEDEDNLNAPAQTSDNKGKDKASSSSQGDGSKMDVDPVPPRRELPYQKPATRQQAAPPVGDDDSTDDEL